MSLLNNIYNESPTKTKSRLKIIDNAFNLFSEEGIDSISLARIADESSITIRNLYRYYASKESLITDVAYHNISIFNSMNKIKLDNKLSGFEQLRDVLDKQVENKLLSKDNNKIISFISYFDVYMTKSNIEHEAIKNYIEVYSPILRENLVANFRQALINGVEDNTLNIEMNEVDCYVLYIFHSLISLVSRMSIKRYEKEIQNFDFIQKHIDIILNHLKK